MRWTPAVSRTERLGIHNPPLEANTLHGDRGFAE